MTKIRGGMGVDKGNYPEPVKKKETGKLDAKKAARITPEAKETKGTDNPLFQHWETQAAMIKKSLEWRDVLLSDKLKQQLVPIVWKGLEKETARALKELGFSEKDTTITVATFIKVLQNSKASAYRKSEYVLFFLKAAGFAPAVQKSIETPNMIFACKRDANGKITANCLELSVLALSLFRAAGVDARLLETAGNAKALHMQVIVAEKGKPAAVLDLYDDLDDLSVLKVAGDKKTKEKLEPGECLLTKNTLHFYDKDTRGVQSAKMRVITDLTEERAVMEIDTALVAARTAVDSGKIDNIKNAAKKALDVLTRYQEDIAKESLWETRAGTHVSGYKDQLGQIAVAKDMKAINGIGFNPGIHGALFNLMISSSNTASLTKDPVIYKKVCDAIDTIVGGDRVNPKDPNSMYTYKGALRVYKDDTPSIKYAVVSGATKGTPQNPSSYYVYKDLPDVGAPAGTVLMEITCTEDGDLYIPLLQLPPGTQKLYVAKKTGQYVDGEMRNDPLQDYTELVSSDLPPMEAGVVVREIITSEDNTTPTKVSLGNYTDDDQNNIYFKKKDITYRMFDGGSDTVTIPEVVVGGTLIRIAAGTGTLQVVNADGSVTVGADPSEITDKLRESNYTLNVYRPGFWDNFGVAELIEHPRFSNDPEGNDPFQVVKGDNLSRGTDQDTRYMDVTLNFDNPLGSYTIARGSNPAFYSGQLLADSKVSRDVYRLKLNNIPLDSYGVRNSQGDPNNPDINPLLIVNFANGGRAIVNVEPPQYYSDGRGVNAVLRGDLDFLTPSGTDLQKGEPDVDPVTHRINIDAAGKRLFIKGTENSVFNIPYDDKTRIAAKEGISLVFNSKTHALNSKADQMRLVFQVDGGEPVEGSLVDAINKGNPTNSGLKNQFYDYDTTAFNFSINKDLLTYNEATADLIKDVAPDGFDYSWRKQSAHTITYWLQDKDGNAAVKRTVTVNVVNDSVPLETCSAGVRIFKKGDDPVMLEIITANTLTGFRMTCLENPGASFGTPDLSDVKADVVNNLDKGAATLNRYRIPLNTLFSEKFMNDKVRDEIVSGLNADEPFTYMLVIETGNTYAQDIPTGVKSVRKSGGGCNPDKRRDPELAPQFLLYEDRNGNYNLTGKLCKRIDKDNNEKDDVEFVVPLKKGDTLQEETQLPDYFDFE